MEDTEPDSLIPEPTDLEGAQRKAAESKAPSPSARTRLCFYTRCPFWNLLEHWDSMFSYGKGLLEFSLKSYSFLNNSQDKDIFRVPCQYWRKERVGFSWHTITSFEPTFFLMCGVHLSSTLQAAWADHLILFFESPPFIKKLPWWWALLGTQHVLFSHLRLTHSSAF